MLRKFIQICWKEIDLNNLSFSYYLLTMTTEVDRIKSNVGYICHSPYVKLLTWLYYCEVILKKPQTFLSDLAYLTGVTKSGIMVQIRKMGSKNFRYVKTSMVKVPREKSARGYKWSLKTELADEESRSVAKAFYEISLFTPSSKS
jgi:hypothetical protein